MNDRTLTSRREFLFCYDVRMGNPNGDPDENRPRILPDGTYYATDVRLKRFVRDYLKSQGHDILVDSIEGKTTNLTGRVGSYLNEIGQPEADGSELVRIILDSFIDARLFGSALAFKRGEEEGQVKARKWEPEPKTLTGATQINQGEVLHPAQEVDIRGTSVFGSTEEQRQGTFTENFVLRYGLLGFDGVANEHSAQSSMLSDEDYSKMLRAMWDGVRSAGNTRTKAGQSPRLLVSVVYKPGSEFQFGRLLDYVSLQPANGKEPEAWSSPKDYVADLSLLRERLESVAERIERVEYDISPDLQFAPEDQEFLSRSASFETQRLDFDGFEQNGR